MMRPAAFAFLLSMFPALAHAQASAPAPEGVPAVRLLSAGSLKSVFLGVIKDYEAAYKVKVRPLWGPSGLLLKEIEGGAPFDVFASASFGHAKTLTEKGLSGPTVMFVRNALCVIALKANPVTTETLVETLLKPDVRLGTSTPGADPTGDYTWEVFHLIDKAHPGAFETLSSKAVKLVGNSVQNETSETSPKYPLTAALAEGKVDLVIDYCSTGKSMDMDEPGKFRSLPLPKDLDVGPQYGLTLSNASSRAAANLAMYILSPAGQTRLKDFGFIPVALPDSK